MRARQNSGSADEEGDGPDQSVERPSRGPKRSRSFCASFAAHSCCDGPQAQIPLQAGPANVEQSNDEEESDEDVDTSFFEVQALQDKAFMTEQDRAASICSELAKCLRRRPTLPAHPEDATLSWDDLSSGVGLPLNSCAFSNCMWHGSTEPALWEHLHDSHADRFRSACGDDTKLWRHFYPGAIASIERSRIPAVGLSNDRRVLSSLTQLYNDENICNLVCTVCGQSKTMTPSKNSHIDWQGDGWFVSLPKASETLDANCGWDEWFKQYGSKPPLNAYGPGQCHGPPQQEWCLEMYMYPADADLAGFPFLVYALSIWHIAWTHMFRELCLFVFIRSSAKTKDHNEPTHSKPD